MQLFHASKRSQLSIRNCDMTHTITSATSNFLSSLYWYVFHAGKHLTRYICIQVKMLKVNVKLQLLNNEVPLM